VKRCGSFPKEGRAKTERFQIDEVFRDMVCSKDHSFEAGFAFAIFSDTGTHAFRTLPFISPRGLLLSKTRDHTLPREQEPNSSYEPLDFVDLWSPSLVTGQDIARGKKVERKLPD
jgi:hypothetical protein